MRGICLCYRRGRYRQTPPSFTPLISTPNRRERRGTNVHGGDPVAGGVELADDVGADGTGGPGGETGERFRIHAPVRGRRLTAIVLDNPGLCTPESLMPLR